MAAASVQAADFSVSHQFTASTPAVADEVNTNFDDVEAAINALMVRIDVLEAEPANPCTAGKTSGAYKFVENQVSLGGLADGGYVEFEFYNSEWDLCLNSDNSFELVNTQHKNVTQGVHTDGYQSEVEHGDLGMRISGTYTLSSGCELVVYVAAGTPDATDITMDGTPSMEVFVESSTDQDDLEGPTGADVGDSHRQQLSIAVKKGPAAPHACTPS